MNKVRTQGLLGAFTSRPARFWTIETGAEWYHDRVSSFRRELNPVWSSAAPNPAERGLYPDGATMYNLAFYSLHNLQFQKLTLTAGGRFNTFNITIPDADLGNSTLTPSALVGQAGISYALVPSLRLSEI